MNYELIAMDILLLILLAVGFISGIVSGAVRQVISLVAFVLGFVIACFYYQQLGAVLGSVLPLPAFCNVVAFILLWVVVPIVARLAGTLLTSLLDGLFAVGLLNRLLGGILGVARYGLMLGALIWLFSSMQVISEETMQQSRLARPLKAVPEFIYNLIGNKMSVPSPQEPVPSEEQAGEEMRECLLR